MDIEKIRQSLKTIQNEQERVLAFIVEEEIDDIQVNVSTKHGMYVIVDCARFKLRQGELLEILRKEIRGRISQIDKEIKAL